MGCCSSTFIDFEIQNAVNMDELVNIMKRKYENLVKEKDEIKAHLENKNNEIESAKIEKLTDDELNRRIPYLENLLKIYQEASKLLIKNKHEIPFGETKEHLNNILFFHYICEGDLNEASKALNEFQKFCNKYNTKSPL